MKPIPELLAEHPFFEGLPADDLAALAACGEEVSFGAGEVIFREGTPADRMYVLRAGRVGLEIHALGRPAHLVTTLAAGEILGASWLFPPYQWQFEALALDATTAVALDAGCVRARLDADPALGYVVVQRFAALLVKRLQAARFRLLDVYGDG
ncbi:MAG: cyclic nucleotide-binding domain-containing protein [Acidimicrobiales bacterium]|nr:cyclic nucleotide-binding domain-containing protein [Acidimicrobiales bacterium]MCB9371197.1 cyclic nucleotide-binding domain-containing protein [Microthrixaceae bacterium]